MVEWIGWALAAVMAAVTVVTLLRRRAPAPDTPGDATTPHRGAEANVEARGFSELPLPALLVDDRTRVRAMSRAATEQFPFVEVGGELLSAFGDPLLVERTAEIAAQGGADNFQVRVFVDRRRTLQATLSGVMPGLAVLCLSDATEAADYQDLRMQFVANVSHELRTPLTGLRGLLEALDDPDLGPELQVRFAQRAQGEADRLSAIMEDVLLLSELETSSAPLSDTPVDLASAADSAAQAVLDAADQSGVEVVRDLAPGVRAAITERMAEMLATNLLSNAVRYAGGGATARLRTAREGEWAVIEVSDDGAGIDEEHLPHVFERFYRVDRSRSNRVGGTGLGLAIVKHIAERAGGTVTATSQPGFGTTVTVRLPSAI